MISKVRIRSGRTFLRKISLRKFKMPKNISILSRNSSTHVRTIFLNQQIKNKVSLFRLKPQELSYSSNKNIPTVNYAEIETLCNHPEKVLIDVREPDEVKLGRIPNSINIPLSEICKVLATGMDAKVFQKEYGIPKPNTNTYIILYCRSGNRSAAAAKAIAALGYTNVHNYDGSWLDYVRNLCVE